MKKQEKDHSSPVGLGDGRVHDEHPSEGSPFHGDEVTSEGLAEDDGLSHSVQSVMSPRGRFIGRIVGVEAVANPADYDPLAALLEAEQDAQNRTERLALGEETPGDLDELVAQEEFPGMLLPRAAVLALREARKADRKAHKAAGVKRAAQDRAELGRLLRDDAMSARLNAVLAKRHEKLTEARLERFLRIQNGDFGALGKQAIAKLLRDVKAAPEDPDEAQARTA